MINFFRLLTITIYIFVLSIVALFFILVDRSYFLYFKLSKIFSKGILWLSGVKLKVSGLENLDKNATYVFVSNHSSHFDIPALQYTIPNRFGIVFKKELSKIPIFGWQLKLGPYVMIDRKNIEAALKSIEEAKRRMAQHGISALLFAEGTRSKTGAVQPFKRGAFYLAARAGYPIIPVTIIGSDKILPKGTSQINSGTIYLHFERAVPTDNVKSRSDEIELMEKVRNIIVKNHEKGI